MYIMNKTQTIILLLIIISSSVIKTFDDIYSTGQKTTLRRVSRNGT